MTTINDKRPIALVILDGWGYAPRIEGNAIAAAHTPYYDEICRKYPMTTLVASGVSVGQHEGEPGNPEVGHLNLGTGRIAQTEISRIKRAIASGEFNDNPVLNRAFTRAKAEGSAIHLIGMVSDGGVHSSTDNLFALVRLAKLHDLDRVFVHCILDGLDVHERTADIYVEALEIKLADIGVGKIASLCGRFFAMDSGNNWERTARAFTMLVHGEGERTNDAVQSIRNSFLRGISDEFIAPIIIERAPDTPLATVQNGDLVVFFNHRPDGMSQLVRSLCIPEGTSGAKPIVETVCLTEYDAAFNLPAAFRQEREANTLASVLCDLRIPTTKITETSRVSHLMNFFDGGGESEVRELEEQIILSASPAADLQPESQSFKITDRLRNRLESVTQGFFAVNLPAAGLLAETGDVARTVSAIRYIDTCIGGICDKMRVVGGVVLITSTYGRCEEMLHHETGEPNAMTTQNPVPFHFIDHSSERVRLRDDGSLKDVAPTVLALLGIDKPAEMAGDDLRLM